jgi:hypothetical protein
MPETGGGDERAGDRSVVRQRAIDAQVASHCALGDAQSHLYQALAAALVGRERPWARRVSDALRAAEEAIERHAASVTAPDGLYAEILLDAPWLARRVERVERQLARLGAEVGDLARSVEAVASGESVDASGVRTDAERMLASLRDVMSQENELVYEQLAEPPALD